MIPLQEYLLSKREIYKGFDDCHDERHFDEVYIFTQKMCEHLEYSEADTNIMLTAAAFHDIGRIVDDEDHEKYSVDALKRDKFIKKFFSKDIIDRIGEIILAHRSSQVAKTEEEKILKDADKAARLNHDRQLYRLIAYNVTQYPESDNRDIYNRIESKVKTSSKFTVNWNYEKCEEVFGELKPFELPDFSVVSKEIDNYRKHLF